MPQYLERNELREFLLEKYREEQDKMMDLVEKINFTTDEVADMFISILLENFNIERK